MIAIPAILIFVCMLIGMLIAALGASDGLVDMVNAPDETHEKTPFNLIGAVFCVIVLVILAGLVGSGPLAGLVTTAW